MIFFFYCGHFIRLQSFYVYLHGKITWHCFLHVLLKQNQIFKSFTFLWIMDVLYLSLIFMIFTLCVDVVKKFNVSFLSSTVGNILQKNSFILMRLKSSYRVFLICNFLPVQILLEILSYHYEITAHILTTCYYLITLGTYPLRYSYYKIFISWYFYPYRLYLFPWFYFSAMNSCFLSQSCIRRELERLNPP